MFKKALSLLLALMLVVASVSITAISVSAADGDEEPDTSTWYVVGDNADMLGKAWQADEANIMTLGGDGKYTKVYTDVAPTNGKPISIKVMNTVDWIGNKYGKNIVFEIDETCDVTVTFDPNLVDATQVTVTGEHVKMHDFSPATVEQMAAVGQGQGGFLDDEEWNLNANIMTEEAPGVYTIQYEDVDAAQMQFKFAANGAWTDNFGVAEGETVKVGKDTNANYDGGNIYFNVNEDGSKVKLTLDMSKFDYESCTGATFKVQVWGPDGEEVVDEDEPGEATEPVTDPQETTAPVTDPATEPATEPATGASGDKLTVTAKSNIAPTFTQTFDPDTEQITVTWWIQSEETMINAQWIMKYDNTVLKVDETPGVNMTFNKNGSVKKNMIFRATDGVATVTNMAPKSLGGSGINCNASNAPTGYMLVDEEDEESRIPFISVTFNPVDGAKGETTVELDVQIMQTQGPDDAREDYFINDSVIVDDTIKYLPESPVAVYAGPIDPDYVPEQQPEQPTTVAPTEAPTTAAPTTEEPTEAPTTAAPTTVAPTEEPTQAPAGKHLTVKSTSNFFQDNPSKTWVDDDIPSQVTVEYYIDTPDKYQAVNGQFYMYYDPNVLQFNEKSNSKRGKTTVMPIADSVVCTYNWKENAATFNFSDAIPGDYLTEEDGTPIPVVRLVFDVVGEGDTTVDLDVYKLTLKDFETETDPDTWYEFNGTKPETDSIRQMVTENAKVYTVILPEPTVVPTQAPTEAPTEAPTTVAPTTEAPTTVAPTTEAPTTAAPTTEAPTTEAPTTAAQTAVITVDTKVDGTHVTELPKFFGFNGETPVTANVGDTLTFAWKLDTDSKPVEAIQWIANFPASLEVDSAITAGTAMPQITTGAELNCKDGVVMANASNIDGYTVDPSANYIVISAKVVEAGEATVTMTLDELKFKETQEPTTAAPTEAPTTVAPTEAPTTVAPTEEPTQAPTTVAPTEEPTQAPTEAPTTAAPTEEPTQAPTEAPTTAAPTEEPTQAPTEAPTTAAPTEEPTQAPTEAPTTVAPATDPTSATVAPTTAPATTKPATSDTATPSNAGGNTSGNGAVQTGTASMALIILLVLVSGTAAIFFARRRERK